MRPAAVDAPVARVAVFGAASWIRLTGWTQVIPWIAPTLIGVPAMFIWVHRYKKKFGELERSG